jgi:hypothetical protein
VIPARVGALKNPCEIALCRSCADVLALLPTSAQCLLRFAQAAAFDMLKIASSCKQRRTAMKQRAERYFQQRQSNLVTHAIVAWKVRSFGSCARQPSCTRGQARAFPPEEVSYATRRDPGTQEEEDSLQWESPRGGDAACAVVQSCGVNPSPPTRGAGAHMSWPRPPTCSPCTPHTPHFSAGNVGKELRKAGRLCAPPPTPDCDGPLAWPEEGDKRSGPKMVLFRVPSGVSSSSSDYTPQLATFFSIRGACAADKTHARKDLSSEATARAPDPQDDTFEPRWLESVEYGRLRGEGEESDGELIVETLLSDLWRPGEGVECEPTDMRRESCEQTIEMRLESTPGTIKKKGPNSPLRNLRTGDLSELHRSSGGGEEAEQEAEQASAAAAAQEPLLHAPLATGCDSSTDIARGVTRPTVTHDIAKEGATEQLWVLQSSSVRGAGLGGVGGNFGPGVVILRTWRRLAVRSRLAAACTAQVFSVFGFGLQSLLLELLRSLLLLLSLLCGCARVRARSYRVYSLKVYFSDLSPSHSQPPAPCFRLTRLLLTHPPCSLS